MEIKNCIFLLTICLLLFAGCGNTAPQNASPGSRNAENNQNAESVGNNPVKTPVNENRNAAANTETNVDDKADFTGTAGITSKKNDVKAVAVLKEIRAAHHEGFDRVVFEFEGAQLPSYHIEYIDKPVRACGSGDAVPLKGDGWLEIRFTPAAAHTEDGRPTIKNREQSPNLKIIREMKSTCDFEAEVAWVLGVASPNRYRVLELTNPTRLAIDIKH